MCVYIILLSLELLNHVNKEAIIRFITVVINRAITAGHTYRFMYWQNVLPEASLVDSVSYHNKGKL